VPRIKLAKEPEGKIVWLEPGEEERLLDACRASQTKYLGDVVTIALQLRQRDRQAEGLGGPEVPPYVNIWGSRVVHPALAESLGEPAMPLAGVVFRLAAEPPAPPPIV
jgi:hypothetical protein